MMRRNKLIYIFFAYYNAFPHNMNSQVSFLSSTFQLIFIYTVICPLIYHKFSCKIKSLLMCFICRSQKLGCRVLCFNTNHY